MKQTNKTTKRNNKAFASIFNGILLHLETDKNPNSYVFFRTQSENVNKNLLFNKDIKTIFDNLFTKEEELKELFDKAVEFNPETLFSLTERAEGIYDFFQERNEKFIKNESIMEDFITNGGFATNLFNLILFNVCVGNNEILLKKINQLTDFVLDKDENKYLGFKTKEVDEYVLNYINFLGLNDILSESIEKDFFDKVLKEINNISYQIRNKLLYQYITFCDLNNKSEEFWLLFKKHCIKKEFIKEYDDYLSELIGKCFKYESKGFLSDQVSQLLSKIKINNLFDNEEVIDIINNLSESKKYSLFEGYYNSFYKCYKDIDNYYLDIDIRYGHTSPISNEVFFNFLFNIITKLNLNLIIDNTNSNIFFGYEDKDSKLNGNQKVLIELFNQLKSVDYSGKVRIKTLNISLDLDFLDIKGTFLEGNYNFYLENKNNYKFLTVSEKEDKILGLLIYQ